MRYWATIDEGDIGTRVLRRPGKPPVSIRGAIGHVTERDVGKRVYRDPLSGVVQVENDDQLAARLARNPT